MKGFLSTKEEIALRLFELGAIKNKRQSPGEKGFKLELHEQYPDAPLSPIYFNFRTPNNPKPGLLTPEIVLAIGQQFYCLANDLKLQYNYVAGVPNAGDPFAEAFLSSMLQDPSNPIRIIKLKKEEIDGRRKITKVLNGSKGVYGKRAMVLLIDDLITTANSKLEAIISLRENGFEVRDVIVFLDREQGGVGELKNLGYNLHSIFTITQLLDFYLEKGVMSQETCDEIKEYLNSNN